MERKNLPATVLSGATARSTGEDADYHARNLSHLGFDGEGRSEMKRTILVVGFLVALLTTAFVLAKAPTELDEGAQLGSAYPEITHWPANGIVSADARIDEGAQLGSACPEITHWPEPLMQVGIHPHILPGE